MPGLSTVGITLGYKSTKTAEAYTALPNLQSTPSVGGDFSKLDTTTLADSQEKFTKGIKSVKDMQFGFLYDKNETDSSFKKLKTVELSGNEADFELTYPDGTKFQFSGYVSVSVDSAKVKGVLTFTATIIATTDIELVEDVT